VAGFLVWLLVIRDDGNDKSSQPKGTGRSLTSEQGLVSLQDQLGHPIYWAGAGKRLELTRTNQGNVYVRYLKSGAATTKGQRSPYTTISTYPFKDATAGLKAVSKRPGTVVDRSRKGALVVYNKKRPTNVYLARDGENVEVEIYDPSPKRALRLATSGKVRPVR
jgi:hypothetical protein